MQILPKDDDFAAGSPAHGAFLCLYLGCVVSTTNVTFWNPNSAAFIVRPMHGAYQSQNSQGTHDYNSAFHSSGSSTARSVSGAVFRRPFGADVTVTGIVEMRSIAGGAPTIADLAPRGVMARVSGGTLAGDGTADVRLQNIDGYMAAVYQKASDSTLRLGIVRWNAGVFTGLLESVAIPTTLINFTGLATITLTVSGTGATVTLSASLRGFGGSSTLTINTTDTTGSRITAAGRCGFFSGSDRILSGKSTVDLYHMLAVDEGGVRLLQDEFRRLSLAAAKQTTADALGAAGSGYLSSAYYWDAGSYDASFVAGGRTYTGAKKLKHTSGTAVMEHSTTDDDVNAGRLLIAQRPAGSQFSQRRSVTITVPSAPAAATGEVWAGIALRASQALPVDENLPTIPATPASTGPNFPGNGTAGTSGEGYLFVCRAKTSTQVIWELRRIRATGAHLVLATLSEFSIFPGYGVSFTMDFDVHPRDVNDPFGTVKLVCRVNGSLLALVLSGSGILNPSTGVFQDPTTSRVPPSFGEGLVVCNGWQRTGTASADIEPAFDSWAQGSLTNDVLLDQDQASIVTVTEAAPTGTALDTIIGPDFPFEVSYVSHHVSTSMESGHRQTMPWFLDQTTEALIERLVFKFKKRGVKATELASLETHWNAHPGGTAFNFTPVGDSTRVVQYTTPLMRELIEPGIYEVAFGLEEVGVG